MLIKIKNICFRILQKREGNCMVRSSSDAQFISPVKQEQVDIAIRKLNHRIIDFFLKSYEEEFTINEEIEG